MRALLDPSSDGTETCPECKHRLWFHRDNSRPGTVNGVKPGDPVECYAAVYVDRGGEPEFEGSCLCRWSLEQQQLTISRPS